jgi:hypothetical protein
MLGLAGSWLTVSKVVTYKMVRSYVEIRVPRIHLGDDSDWYRGMRDEINPTPAPATQRPATKRGIATAMVWSTTPTVKIVQATGIFGQH